MPSFVRLLAALFVAGLASGLPAATPARPRISPQPVQEIELAPGLRVRELGAGVFVVAHCFPFLSNSALVEMEDGSLVLAGTPWNPEATQRLLEWARGHWGQRPIVAINPGYHVDNLGGNEALLAAGVPVYGSDLTVRLLRERGEATRQVILKALGDEHAPTYAAHATMRFHPPDHVFPAAEGLTLTFGGERVEVIYPGPTQAPDKAFIYFPGRRLLFGGCMVLGGDRLGNMAEANVRQWLAALRQIGGHPIDVVIPGHSDRLDPAALANTAKLLGAALPAP